MKNEEMDMPQELLRGLRFTVVTMLLCGGVYPLVVWSIGRVAFPEQADGSLIRDDRGGVVGSRLLAQSFTRPDYFHPRPSAVDFNAASAGGSNFGPSNPDHLSAVRARLAAVTAGEQVSAEQVPSELVTTSGAGLDPHLTPAAAELQAPRVAAARNTDSSEIVALIRQHTEPPMFGVFGLARVNVLQLNLALDARFPRRNPS
jgi:K+-transporting ATPase ATPase C chain